LQKEGVNLTKADYYADIGFAPRKGATSGGCLIRLESMKIMLAIGMKLYLSEYPEFVEEAELFK